ncbi:MAG TPA: hypothetical protein VF042_07860, partial [Gemmatimonadaceae bacterium]
DNQVTEPTSQVQPDETIRAGKGASASNSIIALEPIPGASPSYSAAYAINDLGQAVGESSTSSGSTTAVIWDNSTIPQDLGMLEGDVASGALSISSDGSVIAGISRDATTYHAVRWLKSNGAWLIDPLPNGTGCFVSNMSSDGRAIVGTCNNTFAVVWLNGARITLGTGSGSGVNSRFQAVGTNGSPSRAVLWNFATLPVTETDLGTLGGSYAVATNINDAGQVTGWSENADLVSHAFLWSPRKASMIDLAPGSPITGGGYAVNDAGKVAGDMFPSTQHGGYYDGGRKVVDLGVLPGYASSFARALNNKGQVVGWSTTFSFSQTRATMWTVK